MFQIRNFTTIYVFAGSNLLGIYGVDFTGKTTFARHEDVIWLQ